MAISIDVKRFHHVEDSKKFIAIVPVWSGYARHFKQKPINHIKLEGISAHKVNLDRYISQEWHPDNPYSKEKWIEVYLYHCYWKNTEDKEHVLISRTRIGWYDQIPLHSSLYFVPASQIREFYQKTGESLVYKSKDREKEEAREYEQAWAEAHSNAIANSYY